MKKGLKYLFIPQDVKQEMLSYKKYITPITKKNIGDFKVIYTNNFHSYGMTMYLFKKMLFAGDMVQSQSGRFMAIPVEFNVNEKTYLNYLKKFNIKGIDYICQAHGKPLQTKQLWDEFIKTIN
jgi:glyoxylase-like metal-dependent hydrolase (beta-lactamase superfamily II)